MSDYTLSNIDGILQAVTARMGGVVNELGGAAAASHGAPPRITWTPARIKSEKPTKQQPEGKTIDVELQAYAVEVWGADVASAERLRHGLRVALNALFGVYGQQVGDWDPSGEGVTRAGFAWTGSVVLRVPVYEYLYQQVTITGGQATGTVTTPTGSPTETIPS